MIEPILRFKRDDGTEYPAWEAKLFGSVMTVLPNNTLSRDELTYDADGIKNVHYGDVLIKFGACLDISSVQLPVVVNPQKVRNLSLARLRNGDVVIADTAEDSTVGKATEIVGCEDELVVSGLHTIPCRPEDNYFALGFLGYYINSSAFHDQLKPLMQGVKVTSISRKAVQEETFLSRPCLEEQQKIAAFLSDLDAVISASEDEVAALEQQKKGAMQKIFSQEVRFRRDDGTEYPEWEEQCLAEIVEPNNIPVANPGSNYVKLAIRSHCKGTFHKSVDNEDEGLDVDTMYLVGAYNLIVNITFAWEHAIAITKPEDAGTYVSHRFPQYKFVKDNLPAFYEYVIKNPRMKYELGLCSPGGAGRNRVLNLKDFMKIRMIRPCPEEQQKIADFLSSFDEAIALARQELEKWKLLKKGLMQQMFV